MTIDEAMFCLSIQLEVKRHLTKQTEADAIQLGIEALKKWKVLREGRAGVIDPLLPGETEE